MDALLEPISADAPTGEDLSYDPIYSELAVLVEGTPETQFSEAKEPNWAAVRKAAEAGLKRSKDLQIAVYHTVALTQTAGMAGAAQGLELIAGIVRKYWETLFPSLDPDDLDPTQRVNVLAQLSVESGGYGDPIKFIDRLSAAAIFRVQGLVVTIAFLTQEATPGAGTGAAKLPAMMAGGNPEEVAAGTEALRRVAAAVHALDDFLIETLGRGTAPSFDPLIKTVDKGLRIFDALVAPSAGETTEDEGGAAGGATAQSSGPARQKISGEIQSNEDVLKTLAKIRDYYKAHEPSSPVPLLLRRAEKLVGKNYLELLTNLTPSARSELDVIIGEVDETAE